MIYKHPMKPTRRSAQGRPPSALIVGCQKCATSTVYQILVRHPDISGAARWDPGARGWPPKELHFFDHDENYKRGISWYASHFDADPLHAIEATPEYTVKEKTIRRIAKAIPNAKLIVFLRDPVKRAHSAWNHWNQIDESARWPIFEPDKGFRENAEREVWELQRTQFYHSFVSRGFYIDQIERLCKSFSREQVFVGFSEHLRNGDDEINRLQQFLEVPVVPLSNQKVHARKYEVEPLEKETVDFLKDVYKPYNERLADFLKTELPW